MSLLPAADDRILSVPELTAALRELVSDAFPEVWVRGEVSGLKRATSGHVYFTLKEGTEARLECVLWKGSAARLAFDLRDGQQVEALGGIDIYPPQGRYQLVVRQLRPAGLGALLLQLEALKQKLAAEGLFDASRKRTLPAYPMRIGLVTSPIGAAVRDMVRVLRQRWPGIRIVLAPVRVQGEGAAAEIAGAIQRFDAWGGADLLIVGRGGGSIEDLWAFNEEAVVRAIAACRTPVIAGVGHEVDWTLADLAADVRAATPSHAAELAVREASDVRQRVAQSALLATRAVRVALADRRRGLEAVLSHYGFRRVRDVFGTLQQRVDEVRERLDLALHGRMAAERERLLRLVRAYGLREALPARLTRERARHRLASRALQSRVVEQVQGLRRRALALEDRLRALSPERVLDRGYALVRDPAGALVRTARELSAGDRVTLQFARGATAEARIESVRGGGDDGSA